VTGLAPSGRPAFKRALALLLLVLAVAEASLSAAILYGLFPSTRAVIEVETPLYTRRAYHAAFYSVDFDRGVYLVRFYSEADSVITVYCTLPPAVESHRVGPGKSVSLELYCSSALIVAIEGIVEPLQDTMGVLEVSNTWRLGGSG
jgi:hypothetical protein